MKTTKNQFTVVVGVEFSERGDEALAEACRFAVSRGGGLHAVHVVDRHEIEAAAARRWNDEPDLAMEEAADRVWRRVQHVGAGERGEGTEVPVWVHIRFGSVFRELLDVASHYDADLIVVGSEGGRSWLERALSAGVAQRLHRDSGCAVYLARKKRVSSVPPRPITRKYAPSADGEKPVHSYHLSRVLRFDETG